MGHVPEDGQLQAANPSGMKESLALPSSSQCKASEQAGGYSDRQQGLIPPFQRSAGAPTLAEAGGASG